MCDKEKDEVMVGISCCAYAHDMNVEEYLAHLLEVYLPELEFDEMPPPFVFNKKKGSVLGEIIFELYPLHQAKTQIELDAFETKCGPNEYVVMYTKNDATYVFASPLNENMNISFITDAAKIFLIPPDFSSNLNWFINVGTNDDDIRVTHLSQETYLSSSPENKGQTGIVSFHRFSSFKFNPLVMLRPPLDICK
jgi:hypothetical protein